MLWAQDFQPGSHMIKTNHVDDLGSATNEVGIILFVSRDLFVFLTLLNEFRGANEPHNCCEARGRRSTVQLVSY